MSREEEHECWGCNAPTSQSRKEGSGLCAQCLPEDFRELKAKPDPQLKQATRLYNQGYMAGHEDTVEAVFTPLVDADMETYHSDVVEEIMKEMEENP